MELFEEESPTKANGFLLVIVKAFKNMQAEKMGCCALEVLQKAAV